MTKDNLDRICVFKDGSVKRFEDIVIGEVFQIFEPSGVLICDPCSNRTWFKSESAYNHAYKGFTGEWCDG